MSRDPLIALLILLCSLMIYATLYPFHFVDHHSPFLAWVNPQGRTMWLDTVLNLYFFMPVGLLLGLCFKSPFGQFASLLFAVALSATLEAAQAYIPGRNSSLLDVLLNSVGTLFGIAFSRLRILNSNWLSIPVKRALDHRGVMILISLFATYLYFPFIPLFRISGISRAWHLSDSSGWLTFSSLEAGLYSLLCVLLWRQTFSLKSTAIFATIATLLAPAQMLMWGNTAPLSQVVACMLGTTLGYLAVVSSIHLNSIAVAAMTCFCLLWRELQPFTWSTVGNLSQFSWLPFGSMNELSRDSALKLLSLKCFCYWMVALQLQQVLKTSLLRSSLLVASFLFVGELGQCFQPGRTPEITDPVLALLIALPIWKLESLRSHSAVQRSL